MTLQLTKIEEGMGEGNVLYHSMSEYAVLFYFSLLCSGVQDEDAFLNPMIFLKSKRLLMHHSIEYFNHGEMETVF